MLRITTNPITKSQIDAIVASIPPSGPAVDHSLLTSIGTTSHANIDMALTRLANTSGTNTGDYVHPATDGSLHVPATGTTNSGKVLTAGATAGVLTWETPIGGTASLDSLTDVTITSATNGQVMSFNGTAWVNATSAAGVTDHTLLTNIGTNTHTQIDTALTRLANTSGSNTGDQDLSGLSPTSHDHTGTYEPANANLAKLNVAQTFTTAQRGSISTITYGATITPDFAVANNFVCTLTGNVVVANPTNLVAGQYGKITLIQDATGGRTVGYGTYFKFAGGVAPTLITTSNAKTTLYYEVASATEIVIASVIDWK